jgi:RecA-family ATPase
VLYLALEDSPERIRRRLLIQGVSRLAAIDFWVLEWPGWELLEQEIEKASYRLVVIDTVSRTMEGADQNDVPQMTAVYGRAQRVALGQNTSIVLVDHQRRVPRARKARMAYWAPRLRPPSPTPSCNSTRNKVDTRLD